MNPIRINTTIDKYRVYTIYMPSMSKWFTLASTNNRNLTTIEGLIERDAFENHRRIVSFYQEKFQAEQEKVLTTAVKEIIASAQEENDLVEEIEITIEEEANVEEV